MEDQDDKANPQLHPPDNELGQDVPNEPTVEPKNCLKSSGSKKVPAPKITFRDPLSEDIAPSPPEHQPNATKACKKANSGEK